MISEWIMAFYIYCFLGWCIESAIVSIENKRFVNRGFLRLPMLPLYGTGSIVILISTYPVRDDNPFLIYIFGMAGATILEYVTAVLMEALLKTRYWDYTDEKWNFQGRICVKASLFWGFLSIFLVYIVNPPVADLCGAMPHTVLIIADCVISVIFAADVVGSFKTAVDINKVLAAVDRIKEEAADIKMQIDNIQLRGREIGEENLAELRARLDNLKSQSRTAVDKLNFLSRNMIISNPTSVSSRFNDVLKEIREKIKK